MIITEIDQRSLDELERLRWRHHQAARLLRTSGETAVTRMLAFVSTELGGLWEANAPRVTGTLASATREQQLAEAARVFIDPTVENPVSGGFPAEYGPRVHQRKPWVERIYTQDAPRVLQEGGRQLFHEMDGVYQ